jgi:hypothetical protein
MSEQNGTTLTYRVSQLEREFEKLEDKLDRQVSVSNDIREQVVILRTEFNSFTINVIERLDNLEESFTDDVSGLKKVLIGAAAAVVVGAIGFAVTSLKVLGGP